MTICSVELCESKPHAKGFCSKHYSQLVRANKIKPSWRHANKRNKVIKYYRSGAYKSWQHMKARCYDPKHPSYKYYGGRGIEVCDRWLNSFHDFLADMGSRPIGATLDRLDTDGDYEPGNCRWATWRTQALNKNNYKLDRFKFN